MSEAPVPQEPRRPKRIVKVVRKKEQVVERGPKEPVKQKVVVLRRAHDGEEYVHKNEIPVSIGIPEYFTELKQLDQAKKEEAERFANTIVIFLIGGPGCGKGTQSELILKNFDVGYMSAGELLRAFANSGSDEGNWVLEQMKQGLIVPQEITIGLLKREMIQQNKSIYLIDGFPRAIEQAHTFENSICRCSCALYLEVPDDVLIPRLIERGKGSGRADDTPESIVKRIRVFHEVCEPVFGLFQEDGRAVKIDGNRPVADVYKDVEALMHRILNKEPLIPEAEAEEEENHETAE